MSAKDEAMYYLLSNRKEIGRRLILGDLHITYTMRGSNNEIYHWNDVEKPDGIVAASSAHVVAILEKHFANNAGEVVQKAKPAIPRLRDVRNGELPAKGEFVVVFDDDGITKPFVMCDDDRKWYSFGVATPISWHPLWVPAKELFQFLKSGGE